jgi:hypothetical protein
MDGSSPGEPISARANPESVKNQKNTLYLIPLTRHLLYLVYLVCLVYLVLWLNETNQINQIDQTNRVVDSKKGL